MNIRILAGNKHVHGPGKVYQNLSAGLVKLGHTVVEHNGSDLDVCLQLGSDIESLEPSKTLYGPNLVVLPTEVPSLFSDPSRHFLIPSQWVKDLYSQFDFVHPNNLHVWPVGIDTDKWVPSTQKPTQDCFIYFKNRSQEDLNIVKLIMKKFGLSYSVLEYGSYSESTLLETCHKSKFAVLLTGTESQGIAYMEILSTNTPCYAFNKTRWLQGATNCLATSVPYFSSACGEASADVALDHFSTFVKNLESYQPRDYMVASHTLELGASKLLDIAHANLM